jgi:UDP-N-acetylenolpyruvoylglucosamine reductase
MATRDLYERLCSNSELIVRPDEPMAAHTPLRVGGPVELWVEAATLESLSSVLAHARETGERWRIHWPFSDWLVRDGGLRGTVIRLGQAFESIETHVDHMVMGSAALWSSVPPELKGGLWNALRRWPGSVGGLFQHGDPSQLRSLCTKITVLRGGRLTELKWPDDGNPPKIGDTTVLVSVTLRRAAAARTWLKGPTPPGTLFAQVMDTTVGKELERAGVLGTRLRYWRLSRTLPGVVIQLGGGTYGDLQMLIKGIKVRVEKTRGVTLDSCIPVLGNEPGRRNR